jgi:excisionase family DNA binding protein
MSMSESPTGTIPRFEEVLTLAEAAEYLRISEQKLAELAADGGVPARRIGAEWRFLRKALDDWLRGGSRPVGEAWLFSPSWRLEELTDELLLRLEKHLFYKLKQEAKVSPKRGSKKAVLEHFGVFEGDEDLEERLADARARRERGA